MKFSISGKTRQRAMQFYEWARAVDPFNLGTSAFLALAAIYFIAPAIAGNYQMITMDAVLYALAGIVCFVAAYRFAAGRRRAETTPGILRYEWNNNRAWTAFLLLIGGGFLIKIWRIYTGQHLLNLYIDPNGPLFMLKFMISLNELHYMGIAVAFVHYFSLLRKNDPSYRVWAYVSWTSAAIAIFFGFISSGNKVYLITPIIIYLITKHYLYSRSIARIVFFAALILLVLFPLKAVLRNPIGVLNQYFPTNVGGANIYEKDVKVGHRDLFNAIEHGGAMERLREIWRQDGVSGVNAKRIGELTVDASAGRIGQLHVLSAIIDKTDKFLYGRSFLYAFNQLGIPDSVIKKVTGDIHSADFGKVYGFVPANDPWTGVTPTMLGDFYLNFGVYGIVIGMAILGFLYRNIFEKLASSPYPSGIFIHCMLWIIMIRGFEQSVSSVLGKSLQLFLILFAIQFFISRVPLFGKVRVLDRHAPPASKTR